MNWVLLASGDTLEPSGLPNSLCISFIFLLLSERVHSMALNILVILDILYFVDIIGTYFGTLPYTVSLIFFWEMIILMVTSFLFTPEMLHNTTSFHWPFSKR